MKNILCYHAVGYSTFNEVFKKIRNENIDFNLYGIITDKRDTYQFDEMHNDVLELFIERKTVSEDAYTQLLAYEKMYNLNISQYIHADRYLSNLSKEDLNNQAFIWANKIIEYVVVNKVDFILSYSVMDFISFLLYDLANSLGIKLYYLVFARFGDRLFLSDSLDTGPENLAAKFKSNRLLVKSEPELMKETEDFITNYVQNKTQPAYMDVMLNKANQKSLLKKVMNPVNKLKNIYDYSKSNIDSVGIDTLDKVVIKQFKKRSNSKAYNAFILKEQVDYTKMVNENYFIYPLHFHPEAATLIQGRWFNNQIALIEMISKKLPLDHKLIVKEHKVSIGWRDPLFYYEINKFHNVHFVNHGISPYDLLANSKGVFTISSSMGLEAIMLNKMVVSFGDIMYNNFPGVILATDFSKMKSVIEKAIKFKSYAKEDIIAFTKTLIELSFSGKSWDVHNPSKDSIYSISNEVIKKLKIGGDHNEN